jgi:chromosomal replication initiation ATPase DnaA
MKPTIAQIIAAVARVFKLDPWMLRGNERHAYISRPRQIAFLLAHEAGATHGQIARQFRRERSTISKGIKAIIATAATDFNAAVKIEALRFILERKTA